MSSNKRFVRALFRKALSAMAFAAMAAGYSMLHAEDASTLRRISVENTVTGTLRPFNGATGAPGAEFGEPRGNAPGIDILKVTKCAHRFDSYSRRIRAQRRRCALRCEQ